MPLGTHRTRYYVGLVVATTVAFTLTYNFGMATWEGRPQPLYRSLQVVFQSFTTTGYGEDAGWQTPQMNVLVIGMQLAGIGLFLTAVDVFAVPWLRNTLSPSLPTAVTDVDGHVVICGYTPRGEAFVDELQSRGRDYVVVEPDREIAAELRPDHPVVHGDPESVETLENASVTTATAVVADAADDANASIVLAAREAAPTVRVVAFVEDDELAQYLRVAGADSVLSPRQLLGESLAKRIPTTVRTAADDAVEIGDDVELVELTVSPDSDLCRKTFAEARLRERFGVNVIGAWFDGDFVSPVGPDATVDAGTTLLVAGDPDRLDDLRTLATATVRPFSRQDVIVAGHGVAGAAAADALASTGATVTVLDLEDAPTVDVVGDARDPETLTDAGIEDASALLLTIGDDTTAVFATLIARELHPDLEIVVRANEQANVQKLYRAGADYVQSLATVSGRMLVSTVFDDEEVLAYDKQIQVSRVPAGDLAGRTIAEADVRSKTGCTVVAVVRDGETVTDFDPRSFRLESDDAVVLAGTDESVTRFERTFG